MQFIKAEYNKTEKREVIWAMELDQLEPRSSSREVRAAGKSIHSSGLPASSLLESFLPAHARKETYIA